MSEKEYYFILFRVIREGFPEKVTFDRDLNEGKHKATQEKFKHLQVETSLGIQEIARKLKWKNKGEHGTGLAYRKRTDNEGLYKLIPCYLSHGRKELTLWIGVHFFPLAF